MYLCVTKVILKLKYKISKLVKHTLDAKKIHHVIFFKQEIKKNTRLNTRCVTELKTNLFIVI